MREVFFNGHDITSAHTVTDIVRPGYSHVANFAEVSGSDRRPLMNVVYDAPKVSFIVWKRGWISKGAQREAIRSIMSMFDARVPAKLAFSDDGGRYYMAVPNGDHEVIEALNAIGVRVEFDLEYPYLFGDEHSVTVPSGGSVTFNVGGSYTTPPIITANATRNSSSLVWGLRLDEGDYIHIATGSSYSRSVTADCGERTLSINGSAAIPTLDSDWLELEPGVHTLRMDNGTGAATVTWQDRWL